MLSIKIIFKIKTKISLVINQEVVNTYWLGIIVLLIDGKTFIVLVGVQIFRTLDEKLAKHD